MGDVLCDVSFQQRTLSVLQALCAQIFFCFVFFFFAFSVVRSINRD
jgi:hypothetical protein